MNSIIRYTLETIHPLSESEWKFIEPLFKRKQYSKNEHILSVGEVEKYLYFIEKGVLRSYVDRNESEVTLEFSFEETIFSAYDSFLLQTNSLINVQAITPTVIWRIHYNELQTIYNKFPIGNLIGRVATEKIYLEKSNRELSLLTKTAEELYLDLLSQQPELIREIPLKYIASFIGITPQALSRIRRRIT